MQSIKNRRSAFVPAIILLMGSCLAAADRTTCIVPRAEQAAGVIIEDALFPDQAMGDAATDGWKAYMRIWKAHHAQPGDPAIRRFLGLPLAAAVEAKSKRGRSAPAWLGWKAGSYQQVDTPHFTIYSRAPLAAGRGVAEDLENCYWVWTQMFFPFWEAAPQVSTILAGLDADADVADFLRQKHSSRITVSRKLRVVMFRNAAEYQQTLGKDNPGIERSTGFYNDRLETTFLYDAESDDAATRRHEMVHQLFRQATRSTLGRNMPGEDHGFWVVEGIAGYFESLHLFGGVATLGGWDASRLQFARYRMLAAGDQMPISELAADGRAAAQQRQDIARWYAHGIAQTHHLLNGGQAKHRRWLYQQLADRYAIKIQIGGELSSDSQRQLKSFLSIDDEHLIKNPVTRSLQRLCLVGCEVTEQGIAKIPPSADIQWIDLTGLPIGNDAIEHLAPNPTSVEQLTLDNTKADSMLAQWLAKATNLRKLDLSWLPMDDSVLQAVSHAEQLETLWLTGTNVSDQSIQQLIKLPNLKAVDLQRTKVSDVGIANLRQACPELSINPLELRIQQPAGNSQ